MNTQIRAAIRGIYDLQKLRISIGNRIVANFKVKLGYEPGTKEEKMDKVAKQIMDKVKAEYKLFADGVVSAPKPNKPQEACLISTYAEYVLIVQYMDLMESETRHFRKLEGVVRTEPIWDAFLRDVKGVGPAMAGVILSEIDISKAEYPSSLWKYAGLDVAQDGAGRSRKAHHLVPRTYVNKDGEEKTRQSITFNPFLKTKLVAVLGPSFLKNKGEYREVYDNYRNRLENHPVHKEKTKGHKYNMAIRYTVKRFLVELYKKWREIEGLPVAPEYSEAKLGMKHGRAA